MIQRFGSQEDPKGGARGAPPPPGATPGEHTLPYHVELWDETDSFVEQIIALTNNRAVGYAAYIAAKEQYPHRTITLRDGWGVLSRWPGKRQ